MLAEARTLLDDPHPQCQRLRPLDEAAALRASRDRDYIDSQPVELYWPEDENDPDRGKTLDGFHRLAFLLERNQLPPIILVRTDAPRLHVSRKQNVRRNLPPYERACDMLEGYLAEATGTVRGQPDGLWPSGKELAAEAGVSERTASTALKDYRGPTKPRKPQPAAEADAPQESATPGRGTNGQPSPGQGGTLTPPDWQAATEDDRLRQSELEDDCWISDCVVRFGSPCS